MRYSFVIDDSGNPLPAHVPDLPGCVATGQTVDDVKGRSRDSIRCLVEGHREDAMPEPRSLAHMSIPDGQP